ncbi:hypothetical protein RFI_11593 [Reticulomyxa filosa]|uniref:Uncharacterized protein n=1 Tax=Reticulomyxa filosa TaxID=46433 RepID=X6NIJ8_RETFI|nr:hypothetical protein RFI_11593 [Reticulomyxa filosa]|eukprot:ETO25544.1 hypothetical protein RFI_11593 [Reticulomyxa filosa]
MCKCVYHVKCLREELLSQPSNDAFDRCVKCQTPVQKGVNQQTKLGRSVSKFLNLVAKDRLFQKPKIETTTDHRPPHHHHSSYVTNPKTNESQTQVQAQDKYGLSLDEQQHEDHDSSPLLEPQIYDFENEMIDEMVDSKKGLTTSVVIDKKTQARHRITSSSFLASKNKEYNCNNTVAHTTDIHKPIDLKKHGNGIGLIVQDCLHFCNVTKWTVSQWIVAFVILFFLLFNVVAVYYVFIKFGVLSVDNTNTVSLQKRDMKNLLMQILGERRVHHY